MRIGIDARLWNETGVGRYIRNLVWQLQEIDSVNEYVLFVKSSGGVAAPPSRWRVVETDIRWHTVAEQVKFPSILEKEKLDLVHFPYFAIPVFYKGPFVVTIHDLILHHFSTGEASTRHPIVYHGKRLGYTYIMSRAAQKSKKIITVSNATRQEIIDHLDVSPEKIVVTYEGVDSSLRGETTKQSSTGSKPSRGLPRFARNDEYFLYVGNAYPHKNLERLLLAFKDVAAVKHNVQLVLVGKNDFFYSKVSQRIKTLGISERVTILHNVSDEELQSLYVHATAVVLPSLMEGFGLPAVEAMANGKTLIVSDIPAFREVCGEAGIYFDPESTESLGEKMFAILENSDDPMYLENIKAGVEQLDKFSWEKMARETLKVYESAIAQ